MSRERRVFEHEQWFRDAGAATYAQQDVTGRWMGHVSLPATDVVRFQNEVSAESGFLRLYTSLQWAQQFCSSSRAASAAQIESSADLRHEALWLTEEWAHLAWRTKLVYTRRIPFPESPITVAFTGHRPDKLGGYGTGEAERLESSIKSIIRAALYFCRPTRVISGMALGVDQWAAEVALELGIPVTAAIPFPEQDARWPAASRAAYADLLKRVTETVIMEPHYVESAFQSRNAWMVHNCNFLIGVWDGSKGGTANCVRYAQHLLRATLYLNPLSLSRRLF